MINNEGYLDASYKPRFELDEEGKNIIKMKDY